MPRESKLFFKNILQNLALILVLTKILADYLKIIFGKGEMI